MNEHIKAAMREMNLTDCSKEYVETQVIPVFNRLWNAALEEAATGIANQQCCGPWVLPDGHPFEGHTPEEAIRALKIPEGETA